MSIRTVDALAEHFPCLENVLERIREVEGIEALYPPQVKAVEKGILEGNNGVLAIPTASGKTFIAELAMLRQILEKGGKALYLVPLKALANQKYQEFKEKYEPLGITVAQSTGDFDSKDP